MKKGDSTSKYIELMYSEDSTLNNIEDVFERKKEAAKKAGLDINDSKVMEIINLKNDTVNRKIFEHMSKTQRNNFISLVTDQELFWEIQFRKMTPLKESDDDEVMIKNINLKTTMSTRAAELQERISAMFRRIYKYDPEIEMAQKQVRMTRPEQRIKKVS